MHPSLNSLVRLYHINLTRKNVHLVSSATPETIMSDPLSLPDPIAAYFAADCRDVEAIARCFTIDAVAKDEGHSHVGLAAIKQWKTEVAAKFSYRCEPLALKRKGGAAIVTARVTGNFPGSPVDLRYAFRLERGKIASIEIVP